MFSSQLYVHQRFLAVQRIEKTQVDPAQPMAESAEESKLSVLQLRDVLFESPYQEADPKKWKKVFAAANELRKLWKGEAKEKDDTLSFEFKGAADIAEDEVAIVSHGTTPAEFLMCDKKAGRSSVDYAFSHKPITQRRDALLYGNQFGAMILNVPKGHIAKAWRDNQPIFFDEGTHVIDGRKIHTTGELVNLDEENLVQHGNIAIIYNTNQPLFVISEVEARIHHFAAQNGPLVISVQFEPMLYESPELLVYTDLETAKANLKKFELFLETNQYDREKKQITSPFGYNAKNSFWNLSPVITTPCMRIPLHNKQTLSPFVLSPGKTKLLGLKNVFVELSGVVAIEAISPIEMPPTCSLSIPKQANKTIARSF